MLTNRRSFLAGAAALAASGSTAFANQKIALGIQLYTVRDDLAKDFDGTLKKVRDIGFRLVQSNLTMNGRGPAELRKIYNGLGFTWDSVHASGAALREDAQKTIEAAKAAGVKDITCSFPLYPLDRNILMTGAPMSDWQRNAEQFNRLGSLCKAAGLSFGFHNHGIEFKTVDGVPALDILIRETDPTLVNMEMDIGWVRAAGADPAAYLRKYPKRFTALHIKDLKPDGIPNTNNKMISAVIGTGLVNWTDVLAAARKAAVSRAYLEIEGPYDPEPLEMVRRSYEFLKTRV
ncbi:MAG TPA: sugar phosphate isomerase/epimerase [Rhizomicrobium sp.]|jgi:sugar phosphate isomerase/epimerase|nr:sugar phosphate isomerase/epimerase [Rhizomicrobium sp.]